MDKEDFFQQLDTFLNSLSRGERFIVLGDFDAQVGSRENEDRWYDVFGPHGSDVIASLCDPPSVDDVVAAL